MNKQELIKNIYGHLAETEGEEVSIEFNNGYEQGCGYCIALIEQLDDPRKIIFKQHEKFVVDWLQSHKYSSDLIDLYSEIEYATDSDGFISDKWRYPSEFYNWLSWDTDKLYILADAMRYGYEVDKEQLWTVQINEKYLAGMQIYNESETGNIDNKEAYHITTVSRLQNAKKFNMLAKAEAVALIAGGIAVKVED